MQRKRPPSLRVIAEQETTIAGRPIKYVLKQSGRIRGYRMEIRRETGLTVVVPKKYSQSYVDDMLSQKARWILRHLAGGNGPWQMPLFTKEADHGDRIPFMGRQLEIVLAAGSSSQPVKIEGNRLMLYNNGQHTARALENWYREQAAEIFKNKADSLKRALRVDYRRIFIRGQRTRWASCSQQRNLTFNWKLLFAPEHIIDYVIIHELSHLKYMNHSRKFWEMVARHCPSWKEYRKWLLSHEEELKSYATFSV